MSDEKKEKERLRKQKWRQQLKKNAAKYNQFLKDDRLRKNYANLMKKTTQTPPSLPSTREEPLSSTSQESLSSNNRQPSSNDQSSSQPINQTLTPQIPSAFSTKQSKSRSLKKADDHLPQSPRKKAEIIQILASKYQIRIKLHENRGRPRKQLSQEKKDWLINFLGRSDMKFTNPGGKDNKYITKVNGERIYLPKQYLLWTLRDILDIVNGESSNFQTTFSEKLTFSQLYDFIKANKQFVFNNKIPHTSCLCETCENVVLLAKWLNKTLKECQLPDNPHDLVERYSCSSDSKLCMFDQCEKCSSGKLCEAPSSIATNSCSESGSESDDDESLVSFYRWETPEKHVKKLQINEPYDEAIARFKESIVALKSHIYSKRSQNKYYNNIKDSLDYGELLVHIDFAESYQNTQQDEIQSAYFGNPTFSIFTACCYTKSLDNDESLKKDSMVVISESREHNRAAALTCLQKVIMKAEEVNAADFQKIYVWSDGCAAQFRSRFVFRLLTENFFKKAELVWGYNEKSHGKGPIDGVGGTVKNIIFRKVKSGLVTINSPFEFYESVKNFVPSIHSIYLPDNEVIVEPKNIEQESKKIPETLQIHYIERFQVKNVYALNFFYLMEDEKPFYTQW